MMGWLSCQKESLYRYRKLGCSSLRNPYRNFHFYESSESIQSSFFQWVFPKIKSTEQMRAAYIFQLVEHSPYIDKLYFDAFSEGSMFSGWTRKLCDWLKGLGLITFYDARKKPAWDEFLKGLELIHGESD